MAAPSFHGPTGSLIPAYRTHLRHFRDRRFVYPVVARRSHGVSVGINLSPDARCDLDCVYCQVDRSAAAAAGDVDRGVLLRELEETLDEVISGSLFEDPGFDSVPADLRRLNDIAFSGDGEPTMHREFAAIVNDVAQLKVRRGLHAVKLVLITNATLLHLPRVRQALVTLDAHQGEIWAKLDAGTPGYYHQIDRSRVPFRRILTNLLDSARIRPIVIQSLFVAWRGEPPPEPELEAYCQRLREIRQGGGTIARVQILTVARPPAERDARPLTASALERIGRLVEARAGVPVEVFPGIEVG